MSGKAAVQSDLQMHHKLKGTKYCDVSSEFLLKHIFFPRTGTLTTDVLKDYLMIFLIVVTQTILE